MVRTFAQFAACLAFFVAVVSPWAERGTVLYRLCSTAAGLCVVCLIVAICVVLSGAFDGDKPK